MKIERFIVKNFKCLEENDISVGDFSSIIGENNIGKSTVLQALELFLGGSQIKDILLFRNKVADENHAIELIGHFAEMTTTEQNAIAVRGRMHGDKWIIRKKFWCETDDSGKETWKELYQSYSSTETIINWPEADTTWGAFQNELAGIAQQVRTELGGARPTNSAKERIREIARAQQPQLITSTPPAWVDNPGGGGNWKTNANSILPICIPIRAVHDATEESVSKDASTYGKLVNLIVERRMLARPEVQTLKANLDAVLNLFRPGAGQAEEVRELQKKINDRLNEVIGGIVEIETTPPDIKPIILPNTTLTLKENDGAIPTRVKDQGHGLQRTLIMSLLQLYAEEQARPTAVPIDGQVAEPPRSVLFLVEEPELYMHPQMERKMRDTLLRTSSQPNTQVICTTHSPIFISLDTNHTGIIRMYRDSAGRIAKFQPTGNLYDGMTVEDERARLRLLSRFDPSANEVFFAKRVVVLEEQSAQWAFERAAELSGLFTRNPHVRRDVSVVVVDGKGNIAALLRAMNHFGIVYTAMPDRDDASNTQAQAENGRIEAAAVAGSLYYINPDLEGLLGYTAPRGDKPYRAITAVESLHAGAGLPDGFTSAMNMIYFGAEVEPQAQAPQAPAQVMAPAPA